MVDFALCAGGSCRRRRPEALAQAARRRDCARKPSTCNLQTHVPPGAGAKLRSWEAGEEAAAIADRMEELGFLNDAAYAAQVVRYYSAKGYGGGSCGTNCTAGGAPGAVGRGPGGGRGPAASEEFLRKSGGARSPMIHGS